MTQGMKLGLGTMAVLLAAVGVRIGLIYRANHEAGPVPKTTYEKPKLSEDDAVFLRKQHPDSIKDERQLIGKPLWVSAGGQMDYYRATGRHADYAHPLGTLLGAQKLLIRDVFEQSPPAGRAVARIPAGQRHVLLAFTLPDSAEPTTLYATPVGYYEGGNYTLYTDEIFFYDDPHQLYKHWPAEVWAHVDKHEMVPGMNETQAMMSLGQVMRPSSDSFGDRTVTYDNNGHPIRVVFEHNKATRVAPE